MTAAAELVATWAAAAMPPPDYTVSQWADAERFLPEASAARGSRWRTDDVPYTRGIMDAVHEPGVKTIAVRKAAQTAGSESLHNIVGYFIKYDPCPMLFVHPTSGIAEEWSKERLADMIRTTPALRSVVRDKRAPRGSHAAESTLSLKVFPGGFLALGGANTPNTFARRSVRIAIGDDVDRFPAVVGDEGDPAKLLVNRTTTFDDGLVLLVSTPTLKGGRIDNLYARSDQRQFVIACPECGREDFVTWTGKCEDPKCGVTHFRVAFDERDPSTARLECPPPEFGGCGARMSESVRRQMIAEASRRPDKGWRARQSAQEVGLVGFHLPAMVSTLGDVTLSRLVEQWLAARLGGKESLRVFINTKLAEGWEDRGARIQPHALMARRASYGADVEVPAWAVALTAGVDVQEGYFQLQVIGWGAAEERCVVDWRAIPGDPKKAETRAALLEALRRRYAHASGHQLPIHTTCVDTGYATEEMYDFVLAHQVHRIYATKGFAGKSGEPIVGKPAEKRYGKKARPVRLYPVNVDDAKKDVLNALTLVEPGPRYMHVPALDVIDEEYFAQLCAEHEETRYNKYGIATHAVWVQDRDRNEALDTAVLALAAFRLLRPNIQQMHETLAATPVSPPLAHGSAPASPVSTPAAAAKPAAPPARVGRSSYLGR